MVIYGMKQRRVPVLNRVYYYKDSTASYIQVSIWRVWRFVLQVYRYIDGLYYTQLLTQLKQNLIRAPRK